MTPTWIRSGVADVLLVPILADNYSYVIRDRDSGVCACVDPAEPQKIFNALESENLVPNMVLCTHKHNDHSGGNEECAAKYKIPVLGSAYETTPGLTRPLRNKDSFNIGSLVVDVWHSPCHTLGHLLYFVRGAAGEAPLLFCGDTLFLGGCGKFFEGDGSDMLKIVEDIIDSLPSDTLLFCGHEYSKSNLQFALSVEPNNEIAREKLAFVENRRAQNQPSIPSSLAEERQYNPFLRYKKLNLVGWKDYKDDEKLDILRSHKNVFKP